MSLRSVGKASALVWLATISPPALARPPAAHVAAAERFIDAFYSLDRAALEPLLASAAKESRDEIVFYQGWAKGAHYRVVRRHACRIVSAAIVACPVTVEDDLMKALGIDFHVTDTFRLEFEHGRIASVSTESDDPPAWEQGKAWIRKNLPELIREPCRGYFAGGPTPGECARAMVEGLRRFAASPEYSATRKHD